MSEGGSPSNLWFMKEKNQQSEVATGEGGGGYGLK